LTSTNLKTMIVETLDSLRAFLKENKLWLPFRLIIAGTTTFYVGIFGSNGLIELCGIGILSYGVYCIPLVKEFFKEVL